MLYVQAECYAKEGVFLFRIPVGSRDWNNHIHVLENHWQTWDINKLEV